MVLLVLPPFLMFAVLAIVVVALEFLRLVLALLLLVQLLLAFAFFSIRVHLVAVEHACGVKDV